MFLDSLTHTVDVIRTEATIVLRRSEQFKRLFLGCSGKGKEAKILMLTVRHHFLQQLVILIQFLFGDTFDFGIFLQSLFGIGESRL